MSTKKQIFGWSMYDFANTMFSALFVTIFFPLFVVLKGGTAFHVGIVMSASMLLAGLSVPLLGAVVDIIKRKKLFLFVFTLACCMFTFLTGFVSLPLVLLFGLLANYCFHASLSIYNAMLVDLSTKRNIGRISGIGTMAGYFGTILSVILAYFLGRFYGYETLEGIKIMFVLIAFLFFSFSLFTFFLVKEPLGIRIRKEHLKEAFERVIFTFKKVRRFKYVWLFLLATFLYVDAAETAIVFLYLYARDQLGLQIVQFLPLYLLMAIASAAGAFASGKITDRFGHKKTLMGVLFLWVIIILLLYFKTTYASFLTVSMIGGALLGAIWTVSRPLLVQLAPRNKIAEMFGYHGLTEKFGGVVGPVAFGAVAVSLGFRQALLVVITLFLIGAFVLSFVKIRGKK